MPITGLLPQPLHTTTDKQFDIHFPSIIFTHGSGKNNDLYSNTCSDSDDKAEEENLNDDIVEMMEGDR